MEQFDNANMLIAQTEVPSPWVTVKIIIRYMIGVGLIFVPVIIAMVTLHIPLDAAYIFESVIWLLFLLKLAKRVHRLGYIIERSFRLFSLDSKLILPLILLAIGFILISCQFESAFRAILNSTFAMNINSYDVGRPESVWGWFFFFISGVLLAPFFEEMMFRGVILSSIESKYGIKKAAIYSSIIFGLLHFHISSSITIALGFIFVAYVVYRTNSILSGIIIHVLNNLFSLILYPFYTLEDIGFFPNLAIEPRIALEISLFTIGVAIFVKGLRLLNLRISDSRQHPLRFIVDYFPKETKPCTTSSPS